MNQKFILAFILLVALSNPYDHFNIIVSPDPLIPGQNATFSVSGTLKQDITNNGVLIIEFQNQYFVPVGVDPTTSVPQTTAGNQFNVIFELKVPPNLPSSYNILAMIENGDVPIGCAIAQVN
ncbi:hypothetical protein F8M41_006000 [Gigaspora margarita]|uniref:Phosphatidylglycerol/phosphatidylinositol transfer protein n=1 Tax=Gigaspora margarita TaxID=4874 RepID=A0A8H3X772_GIGMA|nr:hypothetical protein F8M41_006000 [Gigaspora margarita]